MAAASTAAGAPAPSGVLAVAYSGGTDSLALLHASCRAARALGLQVVALHVHHGLMPEADAWLAQAQALCQRWRRRGFPLQLRWTQLSGQPARGDSVEAWARTGRYAALGRMAREAGASLVLLAQHRRDQAETVLLQALRGAGPAGLAAMPTCTVRDGLVWARPWLDRPREAVEAYVRRHRLQPVHDPSNADPQLARSRLRLQVWPSLTTAFPDAETVLAQVARRAQQADALLAEVARDDLATLRDGAALRVPPWLGLSPARQANVLRGWLGEQPGVVPTEALVQRLLCELPGARAAQWPAGGGCSLRLYRGRLRWLAPTAAVQASRRASAPARSEAAAPRVGERPSAELATLDLSRPGFVALPQWGGGLLVTSAVAQGVPAALLQAVRAAPRTGGERLALSPRGLPRSLKKQYQAAAVPVEARQGPLLWAGERLLFVPGLGLDARAWAAAGAPQLTVAWCPGRSV